MENKYRAHATPFYVDFEPLCDWHHDGRSETLVLHLPEFKKEELKIQISNMKILKISGERHVDETKISRFYKRFTVPRDCNAKEIQAKFVGGLLQIKMPKKNSFSDPKEEQIPKIEQEKSNVISEDQNNNMSNTLVEEENVTTSKIEKPSDETKITSGNDKSRFFFPSIKSFSKVAVAVAVGIVVVVGIGALIVYLCL